MMKKIFYSACLATTLFACSEIPKEAFYRRADPETLLDASSEVVNFKVDSDGSIQDMTSWIDKDQPTRAEINCEQDDQLCRRARDVLHQFGIPSKYVASADNNVTLVYERIQARDCESRYIDNPVNPYNLNHPTFGCSLAVNMVQMVSDKRQFTNPAIMDYPDAFKAGQAMQAYGTPPNSTPTKSDPNFQALATQGSLSIDSGGSYSSSSATR